jgi:L-ascorbate metabolism protein UlaG (beta-lactamase superfamily)
VWARIDVVLISHLHHDHLDLPSLRLLGPDVPIVVPQGAGSLLERAGFRAVEELIEGRQLSIRGVAVTAMHARHSGFRPPFGPRVSALGYLIEGTRTVYFAGDTGLFPAMAELAPLDVALLPVGGWGPTLRGGHLDPVDAVAALGLMRPRLAVPIHWGTFWPFGLGRVRRSRFAGPGADFEARARRLVPHTEVAVLAPGGPESRHLPARETAR